MKMVAKLVEWFAGAVAVGALGLMLLSEAAESDGSACADSNAVCGLRSSGMRQRPNASGLTGRPRFVAFSSAHCPACDRMKPVLAEVERACSAVMEISRLDVETAEGERLGAAYDVDATPTFLTVDASGREISRLVGVQPKERLAQAIERSSGARCVDDAR